MSFLANCFFCDDFVGEENGDGGVRGRTVGNRDICENCLSELKHWLNEITPRSPGIREKPPQKSGNETNFKKLIPNETDKIENENIEPELVEDNPFSAGPSE